MKNRRIMCDTALCYTLYTPVLPYRHACIHPLQHVHTPYTTPIITSLNTPYTPLHDRYLSIFTTGAITVPGGGPRLDLADAKFDGKRALLANCSLKDLHRIFGVESILLWNA